MKTNEVLFTFIIPKEVRDRLKAVAEREDRSIASLIRMGIRLVLEEAEQTKDEAA